MTKSVSLFSAHGVSAILMMTAVLLAPPARAVDATKSSLLQNQADQQEVKAHTATLVAQVQDLIDELAANGISGDDAKVLQTTKAVLNHLSSQDMEKVIASLQKADETAGSKDGEQHLIDAYAGQMGIILVFRQILKDYAQRQAIYDLAAKFQELTDRQTQVMQTTAQVALDIAGRISLELTPIQQTTTAIVQTDETTLGTDVASAEQMLDKAVADSGSTGGEGQALRQAQQDVQTGKLQQALDRANAELKATHLLQATSDQKLAREQLRLITKDLNPPATPIDALEDEAAVLNKLIEDQKALLAQTTAAAPVQPRVTGLDEKQGALVDTADSLQQDLLNASVVASGLVKDAIVPMQLSRMQLGPRGGSFDVAANHEQEAIAKLEEARKHLEQQVADDRKANDDAGPKSNDETKPPEPDASTLASTISEIKKAQGDISNAIANSNPPPAGSDPSMPQAKSDLDGADRHLRTVADLPGLPDATRVAVKNAEKSIAQGKDAAGKGDSANAKAGAISAQVSLAQALAAIHAAEAGMAMGPAMANGRPVPAPPGPATPNTTLATAAPGSVEGQLPARSIDARGRYIPTQDRVRVAILQTEGEHRPMEYAPMIEQYLQNLSDQSNFSP
jgi:hypothetical protein